MSKRGPVNNHLIEESPERLALLRDILPGINANKGTRNCVHCALQVDEYLKAGENLGLGPVPSEKSDLLTYPIFKNGKIIRSTSEDPSLVQRTAKPSPYRMICNLNDDTPVFQLDLTDDDSERDPSEARFRKATIENLKEQLIDLPCSSVDGYRYGFILLTRKEDDAIGHLMNFFVDDDVVYLIDAQQPKEKQIIRNSEFQKMMKGFLPEIFFMQSIPPEGFALKIEERPIKVEEEIEVIDEQPKNKQKQKKSIIRALAEGSLLEGVELEDESVKLILKEKYDNSEHYRSINEALYNFHKTSPAFQDKFEQPKNGKHVPCLELKPDHGYAEGQSVQDALISFASSKEKLNFQEDLANGSLLERVKLKGKHVKLVLKEKYNHPAHYYSVNEKLYKLYKTLTVFQANFEQPRKGKHAPCLELKPSHDYADGKAVQDALISFVSSKKQLNVKAGLAEGSLLESIELDGETVKLILKEKYNHPAHYLSINQALSALHATSTAFQAKFEQPRQSNNPPHLKLKPNHGYADGQAIQDALMSFALPKEKLNVKEDLAEGSLLEGIELDGERVKLILKQKYNYPAHYYSINQTLYRLYKTSSAFQTKFEQPKISKKSAPHLKLKPNHDYADGQAVEDALMSFASSKEKLDFKKALAEGDLLEAVELNGDNIKLILKKKYNKTAHYVSINIALYNLYKTSTALQAKFEHPKQSNTAPHLKLKPNHGYVDGQAVQDALMRFAASPKEKLNVKDALMAGRLFERVELEGENVRFILKEKYNNPVHYYSINNTLFDLYNTSRVFQAKFEQPKQGKSAPHLKLKPNHDYADGQAVEDALMSFASSKEKLNFQEDLAKGCLLERVELDGERVKLILKEKYNHPAHYHSINQTLYRLYKNTTVFQSKFEQPKAGNDVPHLKLKPNHDYADGQAVQDALMSFSLPKRARTKKTGVEVDSAEERTKLNVKEALAEGSLFERVELDGENVKLILKEKFNNPAHYFSINRTLYYLHKTSTAFQAKFEQFKSDNNIPRLKLKPNHGYADSQSVQNALISFAAPKERLNVKAALAEGSLLDRVELDGERVKLILKEKYNHLAHYLFINKTLYRLYKNSTVFQSKFELPKMGNKHPCLKLKLNHGYADGQAVQDALISFVSSKKQLNVKKDLAEGILLERVELDGESVKLVLKQKYNYPAHYHSINKTLHDLHKTSTAFQSKFEQPKQGNSAPCLKLKLNHGYANGQAVQDALISFVSSKEKLNVKATLAEGSLLEGVELEGESVKLILKEKYNHPANYHSINHALHFLHKTSTAFQAKFEQPKAGNRHPCLKLKPEHGYADGQSVHDALISFVSQKEKLNVKAALAEGSLLERVVLEGDSVRLIFKEKYYNPAHYASINLALYSLHKTSTDFQAKFAQPKTGNGAPCLKLKPNHGYADAQAVQDALMSFGLSKKARTKKTEVEVDSGEERTRVFLPGFKAVAKPTPTIFQNFEMKNKLTL